MSEDKPVNRQASADVDAEQLVRENIGWMVNLADRLLRDRSLAEDVVQESFILALRGLKKFEGRSSLKTWLHRITVNASLAKLRQLKRLSEQNLEDYLPEFDEYDCRIESPWTKLISTQDILENEQLHTLVHEKIGELGDSYRILLQLRDIEGYDAIQVAELTGISEGNVRVRLHRARAALKKLLEPILRGDASE